MSLANRLNQIIDEQKISKREFAKRVGVSENYVYTLAGESNKNTTLRQCSQMSLRWNSDMIQSGYCMATNRCDKSRMSLTLIRLFDSLTI